MILVTNPTFRFPELCAEQKDIVANSKRIANPGCYPTGMIALTRPLVDAGLLPEGTGLVVGLCTLNQVDP
jgi:N-acetyl-gamma-glutamyl-phosphate reductase